MTWLALLPSMSDGMNPAADPASLPRVGQLRYLAFDGGRAVAALNRTCYLTPQPSPASKEKQ
jgi:hypothetical protein